MELKGRIALVTGASRGIGKAVAVALARRGARVFINYAVRVQAARETLAAVESAGGQGSLAQFDVSDSAAVNQALARLIEEAGGLHILVNNAGVSIDGLLLRMSDEDWERTLEVNLSGVFRCCRVASRHLLKARGMGRIINITSVVGEQGNAGQSSYGAAKAGVIGLTKSLAREFAARGVTVNAVSPGFIDTEMTQAALQGDARARLLGRVPMGRMGSAEDVAEVVAFLAGPGASYVTGQVVRVNGGLLM